MRKSLSPLLKKCEKFYEETFSSHKAEIDFKYSYHTCLLKVHFLPSILLFGSLRASNNQLKRNSAGVKRGHHTFMA